MSVNNIFSHSHNILYTIHNFNNNHVTYINILQPFLAIIINDRAMILTLEEK
jgi:hypothetical protein